MCVRSATSAFLFSWVPTNSESHSHPNESKGSEDVSSEM